MRDPHHDPHIPESEDDAALMRQLFPLDDAAGPAPRRSAAALEAIIHAALDAHAPPAPAPPTTTLPGLPATVATSNVPSPGSTSAAQWSIPIPRSVLLRAIIPSKSVLRGMPLDWVWS